MSWYYRFSKVGEYSLDNRITSDSDDDIELVLKRRVFTFTMLLTSGLAIVLTTLGLIKTQATALTIFTSLAAVSLSSILWYFGKTSRHIEFFTNIWVLFGISATFITSAATGGINSQSTRWFALTPLITGLILKPAQAYIWVAINIAAGFILAVYYSSDPVILTVPNFIAVQLVVIMVIWHFHRIQNAYHSKIQYQSKRFEVLSRVLTHDIRNPLQIIFGVIDRLATSPPPIEKSRMQLTKAAEMILGTINHAKDQLDSDHAKLSLKIEPTELEPIVDNALTAAADQAKAKGVNIVKMTRGNRPLFAKVDRERFRDQVLENVLANAIKFSPDKESVCINLTQTSRFSRITVRDHGIGIPKSILKRIFEVKPEHKRRGTAGEIGSGFGLSIAKGYLSAMHGNIRVRSWEKSNQHRSGTVVMISLPRA